MKVINGSSQQVVSVKEGNFLAIVMSTRHYRHYLHGREFTIRTDHGSLTGLFSSKNRVGKLGRWLEELSQYAMTNQHRPGARHATADGLSCIRKQLKCMTATFPVRVCVPCPAVAAPNAQNYIRSGASLKRG